MLWAFAAFAMWGLSVLFWPLLQPAGPIEILMHRIVWAFVICAILMTALRWWRKLRGLSLRTWLLVTAGGVLNAGNWGLFIYCVMTGQVVAGAMAYFLNPIASATLGVLVLRERVRATRVVALAIGVVAVVVTGIATGGNPVLPLIMATIFGCYALVQRVVRLEPIPTLTGEAGVLLPFALGILIVLQMTGGSTLLGHGPWHVLLFALGGAVTLAPLLAFAYAARRTPLSTMAVMQYVAPIIQFLVGVFIMQEAMPPVRWIGFTLIVVAVIVFTAGELTRGRGPARSSVPAPLPPGPPDASRSPAA